MHTFLSSQEIRIYRSEIHLLGTLLSTQRDLARSAKIFKPLDFYDFRHQLIWAAVLTLHQRNEPVCVETVLAELIRQRLDDDAGGRQYLNWLTRKVVIQTDAQAEMDPSGAD